MTTIVRGEQLELEWIACRGRDLAGVGHDEIVSGPELVERILGTRVRIAPGAAAEAALIFDGERYRVVLREVGDDANFDCAHELGHYLLRLEGYVGADEERYANAIGAALLAPEPVVRAAVLRHGPHDALDPIADATQISQTSAWLRLGEHLDDERYVVSKTHQNIIRPAHGSISLSRKKAVAVARSPRTPKGLVKVRLHGGIDDGRVAVKIR